MFPSLDFWEDDDLVDARTSVGFLFRGMESSASRSSVVLGFFDFCEINWRSKVMHSIGKGHSHPKKSP